MGDRAGLGEWRARLRVPAPDLAVAVLGTALALFLVWPWLRQVHLPLAILAVANLVICVVGFVRGFLPRVRPAQLICFGFLLPYLGVAPIYQMGTHTAAWDDNVLMSHGGDLLRALVIITLGNLALLCGTRLFQLPAPARDARRARRTIDQVLPWPGVPWVLLLAAAVLLPRSVRIVGGFHNLFLDRWELAAKLAARGVTLDQAGGAAVALVNLVPASLALSAAYLFLVRLMPRIRARRGPWYANGLDSLGVLCGTTLALIFANPFANSRFTFVYVAGALALLVLRPVSSIAGTALAAITLLVTLVAYPLANVFRTDMQLAAGTKAFATPDFDGFQQVINSGPYVDANGHSYGHFILSAVGFAVPRSLWEGKAHPASEAVAAFRGYTFTNLSLPIHAELYIEFGYLGVALLMLALGVLLGRVDRAWLYAPGSRAGTVAPLVAMAMLGVVRGPLGANIPIYGTALVLVVLALRTRREASVPRHRARTADRVLAGAG